MPNVVCSPSRTVRILSRAVIMLVALCGLAARVSAQTTVTLNTPGTHINADVTIQGGAYGAVDFSGSDTLATKVSSESYTRRILLKFDTQNYIPANAVIVSAQLYLVLKKAESSESRPLTAFYVARSFVRGETTWQTFRTGQWWSTGGGDLGASFGTTPVAGAVGTAYRFDLTSLVQRTVNGEFGSRYTRLALVDTGAAASGNYREFHSTRAVDPNVRPRLVITYGTAGTPTTTTTTTTTTTATASAAPASTSSSGTTLRVMQWNVHKTKGTDGACNPDRTASVIATQNVDVVSINEVNFYSGTCAWTFDMSERLRSLVEQKTGRTWYKQSVNAGGVGNVILSRIAPATSTETQLSYGRGMAQMGIYVNGRLVNFFSTHVDYDNASWRTTQTYEVVRWAGNFGDPRIVMGDFNTWPGTGDYNIMASPYQDAWVAAQNLRTASSYDGTGATHGASRFDYVYYSRVAALSLKSVSVISTSVDGVSASDHDPVVAVFSVN